MGFMAYVNIIYKGTNCGVTLTGRIENTRGRFEHKGTVQNQASVRQGTVLCLDRVFLRQGTVLCLDKVFWTQGDCSVVSTKERRQKGEKMKKIISFFITLGIFFTLVLPVCAQTNIECSYTIEGNTINVTGKVNDINRSCQVTIFVGTVDNILYLNQKTSKSDGSFEFEFAFPDDLPYGEYDLGIGSNTGAPTYKGTINYVYVPQKIDRTFINAELNITVNSYVPTISGTLSCIEGKTVSFTILNKTNNTVIAEDIITSNDGNYTLTHTLPSLLYIKEYSIQLNCTENGTSNLNFDLNIDSAVILLNVDGQVNVADNVKLNASLKTTNSNLINQSTSITSNKSVSTTIPNLVANMTAQLTMEGIETVTEEIPEIPSNEYDEEYENQTFDTFYIVSGENGAYKDLFMHFTNIADVENSLFTIQYDSSSLELEDLCALTAEKETSTGIINGTNIEIVSVTDGKVQIKYNYDTTNGKIMTGNLNVIRFKKLTSSDTVITTVTERI